MTKKNFTASVVWAYILAAITLTLGILACVFSDNSGFQKAIVMTLGIIMVVIASIDLLGHIFRVFRVTTVDTTLLDYHRSVMTSFSLAVGIIIIIVANSIIDNPLYADIVFDYISLFAGITFIVTGTTALIKGGVFLSKGFPNKDRNIYRVIGGILLLVAGILVLALVYPAHGNEVFHIFFMMLGIYIIIFAVALIIVTTNTIFLHKKIEKISNEMKEEFNDDNKGDAE